MKARRKSSTLPPNDRDLRLTVAADEVLDSLNLADPLSRIEDVAKVLAVRAHASRFSRDELDEATDFLVRCGYFERAE